MTFSLTPDFSKGLKLMESLEAEQINNWLKTQAKNPAGQPLFRLVWSDDQRELRNGIYNTYLGDIFVKTIEGTEWVDKYPYWKERWVFEQWYPPELVLHDELPKTREGSYEPLFIFEDYFGKILPLNKTVIEFMVKHIVGRPKSSPAALKVAITDEITAKEDRVYQRDLDELDVSTDIQSNLHFGEAIIVPKEFYINSPNLKGRTDD